MPEEVLEKRTHVYVMRPREYEISGCTCGNDDPDWSEFKGRLWCQRCLIDFVPEQSGIFDGPIPVNAARLMGMSLDQYNIATGKIKTLEERINPQEESDETTKERFSDCVIPTQHGETGVP